MDNNQNTRAEQFRIGSECPSQTESLQGRSPLCPRPQTSPGKCIPFVKNLTQSCSCPPEMYRRKENPICNSQLGYPRTAQETPGNILFRSTTEGGLGLVNVSARAMANLTKSFLQSVHSSPYMHSIFKAYVMEETEYKSLVRKPSFLPDSTYFLIKEAFSDLRGQIFSLTSKQWQIRITQKWSTHVRDPTSGTFSLLPTPAEEQCPAADWSQTTRSSSWLLFAVTTPPI